MKDFAFNKPLVHEDLKTWTSSFFIRVGNYIISFAGDDGNSRKNREQSTRHYLCISENGIDITEELGFETYGNTINDVFLAREKLLKLSETPVLPAKKEYQAFEEELTGITTREKALKWWNDLDTKSLQEVVDYYCSQDFSANVYLSGRSINSFTDREIEMTWKWARTDTGIRMKKVDFKQLKETIGLMTSFYKGDYPGIETEEEISNLELFFNKLSKSSSFAHKAHKELKKINS